MGGGGGGGFVFPWPPGPDLDYDFLREARAHPEIILDCHGPPPNDWEGPTITHRTDHSAAMLGRGVIPLEVPHYVPALGRGGINSPYRSDPTNPSDPSGPVPWTLGFLGLLTPDKGIEKVLAAFREVRARHPQARLWVHAPLPEAGGEPGYRDFLHRLGEDLLGLVWSHEWLAPAALEAAMARVDVWALPGCPTAAGTSSAQARTLATGRPVIISPAPQFAGLSAYCHRGPYGDELPSLVERLTGAPDDFRALEEWSLPQVAQTLKRWIGRVVGGI